MQAWIAGIIASLLEKLGADLELWVEKFFAQWKRSQDQARAAEQAEANQGKPRDGKVEEDELNDINS